MSTISAGTTTTTAFKVTSDTTGTLVLQTGAVPTTAISISASQVVTFPATTTLDFTGTLLLGDGSAAAPTLAHAGDTNTGIYFPGTDQVAITTAGTQRVLVDASGNVGFGASSLSGKLTIKNPSVTGEQNILTIQNAQTTGSIARLSFNQTDDVMRLYNEVLGALAFGTNNTERARIDSAGNVGIGTSSPTYKLDVSSSGGSLFRLVRGTVSYGAFLGTTETFVGNFSNNALCFLTNDTERMRLDSSGNLGIGTTSPAAKLHVAGDIYISATSSPKLIFQYSRIGEDLFDADSLGLASDSTEPITFGTYNSGTATYSEKMRLDSSGNLGIGTTSPGYKLDVNGQARLGGSTGTVFGIGTAFAASQAEMYATSTTPLGLGTTGSASFQFYTNSTERARITSAGAVYIGTTSATYLGLTSQHAFQAEFVYSGVNTNATNPRGIFLNFPNSSAGDYAIYSQASAATKFYVTGNGVIYSTNTSVQAVSDARHKENVRDLDKGLAEVLALKPRRFDWKEGKGAGTKDVAGFIAQEVEDVLPELVGEWKESVDATETFKSIGMANVIPMLVKAIQELKAELDALKGAK